MKRPIEARGAEDDLVRPLLGILDEILQRFPRLLVVDDQDAGVSDKTRERNEIRIGEFRLTSKEAVYLGKTGDRCDVGKERVAVRPGMGRDLRADLSSGACFGVDHHWLAHDRL